MADTEISETIPSKKIRLSDHVKTDGKSDHSDEVNAAIKSEIKDKFLFDMPDDFYDFWTFLLSVNNETPNDVLKKIGLSLAGPYDVLLGKSSEKVADYLLHNRFYFDTPEFQTILIGEQKTGYHIGYFRDSPMELPSLLVSSEETKGCKLTVLGDNIFAAVYNHLSSTTHKSKKITKDLEKYMKDRGYSVSKKSPKLKQREKKVVSRGFHGIGIVVPVDANEIGWREVPRSIGELKSMFSSIVDNDKNSQKSADELQELITYVQFANDECDYGQGLELGQDLFCFGGEKLHGYIKSLLPMAYMLLNFDAFEKIILAHLDNRIKGKNNSFLQ